MITRLSLSLGHGRAGAQLEMCRGVPARSGRRIGLIVILLVVPITLVVGAQAFGWITGWYRADTLLHAPGALWVEVLTWATLCALSALGILIAARLRLSVVHCDGKWELSVVFSLSALEAVAFAVAAGLAAVFAVHLLADGFACANGVHRAC
jgi:hypothetical protein